MSTRAFQLVLCCALIAVSSGANAVGFGRVTPTAILGQPLSVTIPLRVESGERLFAECVVAEVTSGDVLLPQGQVRVQVSPGAAPLDWIARVTTTAPIEEPVVEVAASAGCEKRFMRRFTAFADPPEAGRRGAPSVIAANAASNESLPLSSSVLSPDESARPPRGALPPRPARAESSIPRPSRPPAVAKGPGRGPAVATRHKVLPPAANKMPHR